MRNKLIPLLLCTLLFLQKYASEMVLGIGDASFGQLGHVNRTMIQLPPIIIANLQFSSVSMGPNHCLGLVNGTIYSWGMQK